tara:strand:- start:5049 stop:5402 length:354 start_codon:yes stop_codon:yes gene_type:complete
MVRRNWINGVKRKTNKTYGERFIDRAMNDGVERTSGQILDAILTYIDNSDNTITYTFVPTSRKISSYVSSKKKIYRKVKKTKYGTMYVKIKICNDCDGSGFIGNEYCYECNPIEEEE